VRGRGPTCSLIDMPVKPTHATAEKLNAIGEAKVHMILTYTPFGGDPATKHKIFVLRKLPAREGR
jgi:hypothetical protein